MPDLSRREWADDTFDEIMGIFVRMVSDFESDKERAFFLRRAMGKLRAKVNAISYEVYTDEKPPPPPEPPPKTAGPRINGQQTAKPHHPTEKK